MRKLKLFVFFLAAVALLVVFSNRINLDKKILDIRTGLTGPPWPTFHGSSKNGGLSPYSTKHVDGTIKWKVNIKDNLNVVPFVESSPVIGADNTIYIATHENNLFAIDSNGTVKWKFDAGGTVDIGEYRTKKGIVSTPAIAVDGTIYITTLENWLIAVNPDGTEKWRFEHPTSHFNGWTSPTIGKDGTIYLSSAGKWFSDSEKESAIYAVNPDGTEKWRYSNESGGAATPAIDDDGTIYVTGAISKDASTDATKGKLISLNKDGELNWEFIIDRWVEGHPTIDKDGTVYIGTKGGTIYALNKDGTIKWEYLIDDKINPDEITYFVKPDYKSLNGISAVPAIGKDGTIYIPSWNGIFYAFNKDGSVKWKIGTRKGFEALSTGVVIGKEGTLYLMSLNTGWLYAFNPDGELLWDFTTNVATFGLSPASPSIGADGTMYIVGNDGYLYALTGKGNYKYRSIKKEEGGIVTYLPSSERGSSGESFEKFNLEDTEESKMIDVDYESEFGSPQHPKECVAGGEFVGEDECNAIMKEKYGERNVFGSFFEWLKNLIK